MVFFLEGGSLIINQVQTYIRTQMMPRFPIPASDSKSIGFCRPGSGCMYAKSSLIAGKFAYLNIRVISACPANTSTKLNLELSCKSLQETTVLGWEWYLFDLNQVKDNTCVKRDVTLTCPASHSMGYPSIGFVGIWIGKFSTHCFGHSPLHLGSTQGFEPPSQVVHELLGPTCHVQRRALPGNPCSDSEVIAKTRLCQSMLNDAWCTVYLSQMVLKVCCIGSLYASTVSLL